MIDVEYALRSAALRWALCGATVLAAVAALGAGGVRWRDMQAQQVQLQAQLDEARGHADMQAARPVAEAEAVPTDFSAGLPETPPAADVVQALSRACAEAGVALASVQASHRTATAAQLGRTDLTVVLQGPYAAARGVLDTVLLRYQALTLQRLRMRRGNVPGELETAVTLSVWSRPAVPSGTGGTTGGTR